MSQNTSVRREIALGLAAKIVRELEPVCARIEIVGSLRRLRPEVHDIDILVLPVKSTDLGDTLDAKLNQLVFRGSLQPVKDGTRSKSYIACKTGINVDIYVADEQTWPTLLLIRTGSKEHNIRLATRAKSLGMKLHASGEGIETGAGERVRVSSEEEIFTVLRIPYVPPPDRE